MLRSKRGRYITIGIAAVIIVVVFVVLLAAPAESPEARRQPVLASFEFIGAFSTAELNRQQAWAANYYSVSSKSYIITGYNRFNLILASTVVNCQSTPF